ncbi:MAG: hypothetical protein RBS80_03995 [Thermoguttaceae bacterium]|jgi:hypothetical protein|nr:hypothetical protein [Thermoguttaceae bacterium]
MELSESRRTRIDLPVPFFLAILNIWLWDGKAETVDALGNVTTATFDTAGNQLSLRDPNNIGWNADAGCDREDAASCRMDFSPSRIRPQSLGQTGKATG